MSPRSVLVVDDNRDMANGIAMLLSELEFEVHTAYSARSAITKLGQRPYAVVLSDVRMPNMDGVELLATVRERWPHTHVILITAHGSIDSAVEAMKRGATDYLTKPFDNQALIDVVRRAVNKASSSARLDIPAVVAEVAATLSPDDLFPSLFAAVELLRRAASADDAELFLLEPDGRDALLTVCVGPDGEALGDQTRFGPNVGYPGIVASTGRSLGTQGTLADDPRYLRQKVVELGIRSYACAPLLEPRGSLGSIHLLSRREDFAIDDALLLLERASIPIANAVRAGLASIRQAVDQACAPHEEGSAMQLRALLECIRRAGEAHEGTLALVDPTTGRPTRVVSSGPAPLLCAHAEEGDWAGCPSVLGSHGFEAEHGRRSWPDPCRRGIPKRVATPCCVPLAAHGRFHGLVTLDLGRAPEGPGVSRLVPMLVAAQQAGIRLAASHPGYTAADGDGAERAADAGARGAAELELRCLGPFRVLLRGSEVRAEQFPRSKALVLLKLLALKSGTPVSRDYLIEQLWPGADPQSGSNRLHGVVHALRSVIEPLRADRTWLFVRNRGELYYLDVEAPITLDLVRYRQLLRRAAGSPARGDAERIELLEEAAQLYRGALFEDDPYAEWCEDERRSLEEQQVAALDRLARLHAAGGDADRGLVHLRAAVRLAPHREDLVRVLLERLVGLGRASEARATYEDFRRTLARDLGGEPSEELGRHAARLVGAGPARPARLD